MDNIKTKIASATVAAALALSMLASPAFAATNCPSAIDTTGTTLPNPGATDAQNAAGNLAHHIQESNKNDAVRCLETLIGLNATQTAPTAANSVLQGTSATASTWTTTPTVTTLATTGAATVGNTLTVTAGGLQVTAGNLTLAGAHAAQIYVGMAAKVASSEAGIAILTDQNTVIGMAFSPVSNVANGEYIRFTNAAGTTQGNITATNSTTTAYNTSSDQRLKNDFGLVSDLSPLRNLEVHDAAFKVDGLRYPMFFAQQAEKVAPFIVTPGSDDRTAAGDLIDPWKVHSTELIPLLTAGWQDHDNRIVTLEAKVKKLEATAK